MELTVKPKSTKFYVNSKELEEWWAGWRDTGDVRNWERMSEMLYLICLGISKNFRPRDDEEHYNLANEAATKLFEKIKTGKLKFKPTCQGGSPVFNLVTTTVQRLLCSFKNSDKRRRKNHSSFVRQVVQEKAPELLSHLSNFYDNHDSVNSTE
ncbi:hypothetical protein CCP1ISM_20007 [Azospirillaceae bacterium]